jgi:hypothetical protein
MISFVNRFPETGIQRIVYLAEIDTIEVETKETDKGLREILEKIGI